MVWEPTLTVPLSLTRERRPSACPTIEFPAIRQLDPRLAELNSSSCFGQLNDTRCADDR